MKTRLGDLLRNIRMSRGEILKEMAEKLGVSSAFLSAIENGKKKLPVEWFSRLQSLYGLSKEQLEELRIAVLESSKIIELNLTNAPDFSKELAVSFAREFEGIDEETSSEIMNLLKKKRGSY